MRTLRTFSLVVLALPLVAVMACGGSSKAFVPVDSPLTPAWSPPEGTEAPAADASAAAPAPAEKPAEQPAKSK